MKPTFDPPKIIKMVFKNFIWNTTYDRILLTFDDGPNVETTPIILKKLDALKIKSVFFCVGNNLDKNPSLVKEILSAGHTIGNHTWNHKKITDFQKDDSINEIYRFNTLMLEKYNYNVKLFRPPHGRFNFRFYRNTDKLQMKVMMWSLLTYDYKNDIKVVKFALKNYLSHNSIIVMHDSLRSKSIVSDSIQLAYDTSKEKKLNIGDVASCLN